LKATDKQIIFSNHHFQTTRFGSGWSWDDFSYNYQPERTAFPIYGNRLWVERYRDSIVLTPKYFSLVFSSKKDQLQKLTRDEWGTQYLYSYNPKISQSVSSVPVSLYKNDIRFIWQEVTGKNILFRDTPLSTNALRFQGSDRDTILKLMLQESENFIAEQILLSCSLRQTGVMNEKDFIKQVLRGPLKGITDSIMWVDGSGLSRYNQLTPRSVIWLLEKSLIQKGPDYIKNIFAAGGQSGTLNNSFHAFKGKPYIFAKSGSMRNVYNLSGLLITKRGNILLFSWMNNNFSDDTQNIIKSMEIFLAHLRDHY
jgi:D-alanyl-D-alanine carboxypeptidase/D-alanyl-D-alanine-endopeptidase (penicillin-binding protein 4)